MANEKMFDTEGVRSLNTSGFRFYSVQSELSREYDRLERISHQTVRRKLFHVRLVNV